MGASKPAIRTLIKPLAHHREPLASRQVRHADAGVYASSGIHADCESILSKRASKVVEQTKRIARCTPSDGTKQSWSDIAAHSRARFARRPDFKQPSLLREGLSQLQAGCVNSAVDTLRKANPRAPAVRTALVKAEAMLADLGKVATIGQVAKWEWAHNTKTRLNKLSAVVNDALGDEESEWLKSESVQSWNVADVDVDKQTQHKNWQAPAKCTESPVTSHAPRAPADSALSRDTTSFADLNKDTPQEDNNHEPASPVFSEGGVSPDVAVVAREFGFLPPPGECTSSDVPHMPSPWPTIKRAASQTPMVSLPAVSTDRRCRSAQQNASTPSYRSSPVWERLFRSEEPGDAAVAQARTGRRHGNTTSKAKTKLVSRLGGKPASAPAVTVPQAQHSIYESGLLSEVDIKQGRKHRRKAATPITSTWQPGDNCSTIEREGKPRTRDRKVSSDPPQLRAALAEVARLEAKSRSAATCKASGKLRKQIVYGSEL